MIEKDRKGCDKDGQVAIAKGLRKIRQRRWFFGGLILAYVPVIWATLEITGSDRQTGIVFFIWIALVTVAACLTALSPCPRCGNPFHMHGFVPVYFLRKCLHCGLGLKTDAKP